MHVIGYRRMWRLVPVWLLVAACSSSTSTGTKHDSGGVPDGAGTGGASGPDTGRGGVDAVAMDGGGGSPIDSATRDSATNIAVDAPAIDGALVAVDAPAGGIDAPASFPDGAVACGGIGTVCASAADCCGFACLSGFCAASACLSDGVACTSGSACCSTVCGAGGTCTPLNTSCKTSGNTCTTGAECCNGVCNASNQCASPSDVSFCAQTGDLCRRDSECCTGVCQVAAGAAAGTCAAITTSCQVDGTVCNGCGSCCSHFCGPFGAGGPHVCQPASGCHVQGDLCHRDSDCCGGDVASGLPGAGLIKCEPDPVYGARIGTCGGPRASNCPDGTSTCKNSCNPEGNVCHFKETRVCAGDLTNVRNDCCDCISGKECCQPDATGIPRCNSLAACVPTGGSCSFSGECCGGEPCLPDPATGHLRCGSSCVQDGGLCTTNADCCAGMLCQSTPGSLAGTCMVPPPPPVSAPDAGVSPDAPPVCAYYGQACSASTSCCGGISCVNRNYEACAATDTGCICYSPE
jgi:hypothetical protein